MENPKNDLIRSIMNTPPCNVLHSKYINQFVSGAYAMFSWRKDKLQGLSKRKLSAILDEIQGGYGEMTIRDMIFLSEKQGDCFVEIFEKCCYKSTENSCKKT